MTNHGDLALLANGCRQLNISVTDTQLDKLLDYRDLLLKWTKVYSLTAITHPHQIIIHHLLDGLSIVTYFSGVRTILDVGSGMGVPGVILAIMFPEINVTVVDSNSKKTAFLRQVKIELGLQNLVIETKRVEALESKDGFDIITSRAFADLSLFIDLTQHLLHKTNGCFLAMKSERGLNEVKSLNSWQEEIIPISVPSLEAQRFLIKITPK